MKKIYFFFAVGIVLLFSSCDGLSFSDGTITVNITGLDQIPGFNSGASDVYIYTFDENEVFVHGWWFNNYSGTSITTDLGANIYDGGNEFLVDVLVDTDGDDDLDTGVVYWLTYYKSVIVDGNMQVSVISSDFEVK